MAGRQVLLVEDDEDFGHSLAAIMKQKGFTTQLVASGEAAMKVLAEKSFDVIVTDMLMPGMNGMEFLKRYKETHGSEVPVIMVTGYGSVAEAVEAMKSGAFGYFLKPVNQDEIFLTIEKAVEMGRLKNDNHLLRQEISENRIELRQSNNSGMQAIFAEAAALATSDVNVLITGESGVGKEVVARYIHEKSRRMTRPFVAINCQAYATSLIESELFGYSGGAFTGARASGKKGKIQMVAGGTLFLDEIGDLDLTVQIKMLRVLETHSVEPVGGATVIPVDFRLISATNQELAEKMSTKLFRDDLYYRINTVRLHIPPLRERREDILPLGELFLKQFAMEQKKPIPKLASSAVSTLLRYDWPGNVRELKNAMEAAVALTKGDKIEKECLRLDDSDTISDFNEIGFSEARRQFEHEYFRTWYVRCGENIAEMARRTKVDRKQLYKKLYEYGIVHKSVTHPMD